MAQRQLEPFRSGTRQKYYQMNQMVYSPGQTLNQVFPQVGMLSQVLLSFTGTITYSAPGTLTDEGPWNLLSRIQINTNIGSATVVDLSGFGAYLMQQLIGGESYRPDTAGSGATTPNANIFVFPLSGTAQAFTLSYIIPVGANDGLNFESGLLNLQAPQTQVTLSIQCAPITAPASNVTGIPSGVIAVGYWYYEIPDLSLFELPPLSLVRTLEYQTVIGGTGEQFYTLPQMGTLLQCVHTLTLNGARSDSFDYGFVRFNKTDTVYQIPRNPQRMMERLRYGLNPITGSFYWDFWHAYGQVSEGDVRDAIDTQAIATLDIGLSVSAGATLGSNNNFLRTIERVTQTIQVAG